MSEDVGRKKVFLAEIGKKFRVEFLFVTGNFQGGRRVYAMIPKGMERKGWGLFGRAMEACLNSEGADVVKGKDGVASRAFALGCVGVATNGALHGCFW